MPVNAVEELNQQLGAPAGDLNAELDQLTAVQYEGSMPDLRSVSTVTDLPTGCA